ncbi:Sensor protein EvgS precursor [Planctomycetes bacterium MalM25]|nr:Sensor protein EvgS precursor [Planctomycetes bacterium MalM25]
MASTKRNVLVVDDEPQVRELTSRALLASGIQCDLAVDGADAIKKASERSYDAVVTDLRMPNRHGHALCADLLKLPEAPNVMVLTALSDARLVRDLMSRGVYDVLHKPINYDVVATKVQAMIENTGRTKRVAPEPPKKAKSNAAKKINLLHQIETTLVELTELFDDRLEAVFDFAEDIPDPPKAVRDFIRRLAESEVTETDKPQSVPLPGHQARGNDRVTCYTIADAVPVDRDWNRTGDPFKIALRDLSESGGRFLHTRATNADYVAICWNATQVVAKQIRVVCRIRRCKPCGPFYDIGGQFVMAD